jgi:prevent-host-death family protein
MLRVGVRVLKAKTSEILRRVRDDGETVEVQHRGEPIAHIVPIERHPQQDLEVFWASWERLEREIGANWPDGVGAAEAIAEDRRDL